MTFNDDSRIGSSKVRRRGRTAGIATGGGLVAVVAVFFISQFLGVDVSGLVGGGAGSGSGSGTTASDTELTECRTGADANENVDCRMVGAYNSLDAFWSQEAAALGYAYRSPELIIFEESVQTGCGAASSATGPFYCPPDETVYIDTGFYDELRSRFGASGGPLAEIYVVAHEFGHHIEQVQGSFAAADRSGTGPGSDSIRLEVQADCFAGAWVAGASQTVDSQGTPLLEPITTTQVADALDAASAVGDDRIQGAAGGDVNPETWTHGSSEQRQRWFTTGYEGGVTACSALVVPDAEL